MNIHSVFIPISTIWILSKLVIVCAEFAGARLAEIHDIRRQRALNHTRTTKLLRRRASISIILYCRNQAELLAPSLHYLTRINYRKLDIIVVDDASTDSSKKIVKQFISDHPNKKVRLYSKRKYSGSYQASLDAARAKARNDLVFFINVYHRPDQNAFRNLSIFFATNPHTSIVPAVKMMPHASIIGLLQQFESSLYHHQQKSQFTNPQAQGLVVIPRAILRTRSKQVPTMTIYAHWIPIAADTTRTSYSQLIKHWVRQSWLSLRSIASTPMWPSVQFPLKLLNLFVLLFEPIVVIYLLFVAIQYQRPALFLISVAITMGLIGFAIWTNELTSLAQKVQLTIFLPFAYVIQLCKSIVMAIAGYALILRSEAYILSRTLRTFRAAIAKRYFNPSST
jgi:hypothetical protein